MLQADLKLAWELARRDLRHRYASSYGGFVWNIGVPLLYAVINVLVFSLLLEGRLGLDYQSVPFAVFYFIPYTLWILFMEVSSRSTSILKEYSYLINKIAFPVWVLPLVSFASALLTQIIVMAICAGLLVYHGVTPGDQIVAFALIWLLGIIYTLAAAYSIAALSVYIPDLVQVVPVWLTISFWLTPILYPTSLVLERAAPWFQIVVTELNPFYYLVELARGAVLGTELFSWSACFASLLFAVCTLLLSAYIFKRLQPGFADVL